METHQDDSHRHPFMDRLRQRADEMIKDKQSEITAGKDGEPILEAWKACGVSVRHLPPDEQGILRISVGGGETPVGFNYCVFRGDLEPCIDLLRKALAALETDN